MLDYQTKGCSRFGASMGRRDTLSKDSCGVLKVRRVPLDSGGYDPGGAYWGGPADLFHVTDEAEETDHYVRAEDIEAARAMFPRATWAEESEEASAEDLADMFTGYVEAALWSTSDHNGDESGNGDKMLDDSYNESDLTAECEAAMREQCAEFAKENASALRACLGKVGPYGRREVDWSLIGHIFWLARSGSGVGFTDGDFISPHDETLQVSARKHGEVNLYAHDGKIHL